jgi:hypothetical protein
MRRAQITRLLNSLIPVLLLLTGGLLPIGGAYSEEVFKWTDSAGKVHYGDKPADGAPASRLQIAPAPAGEATPAQSLNSVSDTGYSATLHYCLVNGGSMDECVAKASTVQTNKMSTERAQAEAEQQRALYRQAQQPMSLTSPLGVVDNSSNTATRAAALAAERARQRREQQDQEWKYK